MGMMVTRLLIRAYLAEFDKVVWGDGESNWVQGGWGLLGAAGEKLPDGGERLDGEDSKILLRWFFT